MKLSEDELIGVIHKTKGDVKRYFKKGDIYWSDFKFVDIKQFTCNSIAKDEDGGIYDNKALGKIKYKKGTLHLHLTPEGDHILQGYDTYWKKVE